MKTRYIALLIVLAVVAGCAGWLYHQYQKVFGPSCSLEKTARIIVHDSKFGMRAKQKAIRHGDEILPLIQKESHDFTILNGRNAFWIADVLGKIRTQCSHAILMDLYSRTNAVARLTGAIGLAQHRALPDPVLTTGTTPTARGLAAYRQRSFNHSWTSSSTQLVSVAFWTDIRTPFPAVNVNAWVSFEHCQVSRASCSWMNRSPR
ncbi:MAG: hypothetical protein ACUVWX_14685 [Kiritimatiellia bacterium]